MEFDESDKKYVKNVAKAVLIFQAVMAIILFSFISIVFTYIFKIINP